LSNHFKSTIFITQTKPLVILINSAVQVTRVNNFPIALAFHVTRKGNEHRGRTQQSLAHARTHGPAPFFASPARVLCLRHGVPPHPKNKERLCPLLSLRETRACCCHCGVVQRAPGGPWTRPVTDRSVDSFGGGGINAPVGGQQQIVLYYK
jgi:hypothetical protein